MPTKKTTTKKAAPTRCRKVAEAVPVRKTTKTAPKPVRVVLTIQADSGSSVFVAGSFNDWNATQYPMKEKAGKGVYSVTLPLVPGVYEYKFIVNGVWTLDPDPDRDWTQNGLGTLNSVLRVD